MTQVPVRPRVPAARLWQILEEVKRLRRESVRLFEDVAAIVDRMATAHERGVIEAHLAGCTSMTDLIVVARPISPPPLDVVIVRHVHGSVTIEHVTHIGRNDRIERAVPEAVALFWRFMIEKFGVHPTATGAPPDGAGPSP